MRRHDDLVCPGCGSDRLFVRDRSGYNECRDCGRVDYSVAREDYEPSEAQQGLMPIPKGYAEQ